MADCLSCGASAEYQFHLLEVQTLHVRDFTGEKRVQALGLFQDYGLCADCARAHLEAVRRPGKALAGRCALFAVILALGVATTLFVWSAHPPLRLFGLAAIACGVLGLVSTLHSARQRSAAFAALSEEEALSRAAWECLVAHAPKKSGENDLTYIPVDSNTLAMKNGDLMLRFDLLPGVAKKAWELLHEN